MMSQCYTVSEAQDLSSTQHGAGRQHLYARYHNACDNMVMGSRSSSRFVPGTRETARQLEEL